MTGNEPRTATPFPPGPAPLASPHPPHAHVVTPPPSPPLTSLSDGADASATERAWATLNADLSACVRCPRAQARAQAGSCVLHGGGARRAGLMFVQASPSAYEAEVSSPLVEPLVGTAFIKTLSWLGLARHEVYVTSLLKCATSSPTRAEWEACRVHFERELALVAPRVIVALGPLASQILLNLNSPIVGEWGDLMGIPVMPTFHFSEMVRAQDHLKHEFSRHLRRALTRLELLSVTPSAPPSSAPPTA